MVYTNKYKETFVLDEERNQPLSIKILQDPQHPVTELLLYCYSIRSQVFAAIESISKKKDAAKVATLGPYLTVLFWIASWAAENRQDISLASKPNR